MEWSRLPRRILVVVTALLVAGAVTLALFSQTTANSADNFSSTTDWKAPTVSAAVIQPNGGNNASAGFVAQGQSYFVYANVADTGNPASGISTVTANVNNITTGSTAVAMSSGSFTVNSVTYNYRSAALTASNPVSEGSKSYSIAATDAKSNSGSTSFSVTVDNTAPTVTRQIACGGSGCSTTGYVGASKAYFIYAQVSDASSGINTVTTDPRSITAAGSGTTAMTTTGGPWTIGGNSYNYRTASLTADSGLANAATPSYTVTPTDNVGNTSSPSATATVDNVAPTLTNFDLYKTFGRLGGGIRAGGTYYWYANVADSASGIDTSSMTLDSSQLTAGKTGVPMCYSASNYSVPSYGSPGTTSYSFKGDSDGVCDGTFTPLTADAGLANGAVTTSTITYKDNAGNSTTSSKNITVNNTAGAASSVDIQNTSGGTTGRLEQGDTVVLTTTDSQDPESIQSGWLGSVSTNVVVRLTDGGGSCVASSDQLQVWNAANTAQLPLGTICLGGTGYNTSGTTITFGATGTPSTMTNGGFTVADSIVLGTASATAATQAGNTTASWAATSTMYDQAGTNYSTTAATPTIDNTAPTISAARICGGSSCTADSVGAGKTYFIYANATDANAGIDANTGVTANVSNITTGATSVALTTCSSGCTVNGVTYAYKSAQQTSTAGISGTKTWTLNVSDKDGNKASTTPTATVDTTAPTVTNSVIAKASGTGLYLSGKIKQGGTYYVYSNVSDAGGAGLDTVTANVNNITTGSTAVAMSSGSFSVNGTSYNYRSAAQTANATLTNGASLGYSVTATDNAVNATTFSTPTVTVDNTAPTASTTTKISAANKTGGTAGLAEVGDTITYTYSEQIDPESILAGWTGASTNVTVRLNNNTACPGSGVADDNITIFNTGNTTQANIGCIDLGSTAYVTANVTYGQSGSTTLSTMSQSGSAITVTLGSTTGTVSTVSTAKNMIWWPSTSAFDAAGNAETSTSQAETDSDVDF